jgi:hypothetical protein
MGPGGGILDNIATAAYTQMVQQRPSFSDHEYDHFAALVRAELGYTTVGPAQARYDIYERHTNME